MINFRDENIEKTIDYQREVGTETIDKISSCPYSKFVHFLDPEGNEIELWEANGDFFNNLMGPANK